MNSDERLRQALAEIREPVPEDLERWVLELAGTTPDPVKTTTFPWHWLAVILSFVPVILVLGIRVVHQAIADYFSIIVLSGLKGITTNPAIGIPVAICLVPILLYSILSYRDTLRLHEMAGSVRELPFPG